MAQNLVPNGSFEEYTECPTTINGGNYFPVVDWTSPTTASPDYFNSCGSIGVSIPNNLYGIQTVFSGNGYVGIVVYREIDYTEYVQVALTEMLLAGQKYYVSFNVSLAEKSSSCGIKEIGAYFSPVAISTNTSLHFTPQIQFSDSVITDTIGWTNIKGSFIANGNEQYLLIGNFNSHQNTTSVPINYNTNVLSYYYVDEVCVSVDSITCGFRNIFFAMPTAFTPNNDGRNDVYAPVLLSGTSVEAFRIYNRWGQKVYDGNMGWDGIYIGQPQPTDTYLYYVEVKNKNGNTEKRTGSFTLLR